MPMHPLSTPFPKSVVYNAFHSTVPFREPQRAAAPPVAHRLTINGNAHFLKQHLVDRRPDERDRILVAGDRYTVAEPTRYLAGGRYPDLLVAFDVDPAAYAASNGYIIAEQGKPPDFVLEIASRSSGREDTGPKRGDYAAIGIPEYWRFDETGEHHGVRLAGDRLENGEYAAIEIAELPDGSLQGYSAMLDLYLRWEAGELLFYDPATQRPILTYEDQRARADNAEAELAATEARVRELEARLRQQNP